MCVEVEPEPEPNRPPANVLDVCPYGCVSVVINDGCVCVCCGGACGLPSVRTLVKRPPARECVRDCAAVGGSKRTAVYNNTESNTTTQQKSQKPNKSNTNKRTKQKRKDKHKTQTAFKALKHAVASKMTVHARYAGVCMKSTSSMAANDVMTSRSIGANKRRVGFDDSAHCLCFVFVGWSYAKNKVHRARKDKQQKQTTQTK